MGDAPPAYQPSERIPRRPSSPATEGRKEHLYSLTNNKNKAWATLKVFSSGRSCMYDARSAIQLPTFFEGEPITGSLELAADKWDHIEAVELSVKGSITTGVSSDAAFTFLDLPRILWSKSAGEPGRINDHYTFPFSISMPKDVAVIPKATDNPRVFPLPPTISERHTKANIQYELTAHIRRRGMLRTDSKLGTAVAYIPSIQADPPSRLRQRAYEDNTNLVGPQGDPEGWKTFQSLQIRGKLLDNRPVDVTCTLSLAKPLSYTRGSVIPCIMTLDSEDSEALDMLSSPNSIFVRLRRHVSYHADARISSATKTSSSDWKDQTQDYELAAWWPSTEKSRDEKPNPRQHRLEGEISLAKDLVPSAYMAHFSVTYSIVVFPFDTVGFRSEDTEPLLMEPVQVVTMFAPGPRPIAYAPPEYHWGSAPKPEFLPSP